MDDDHDDLEKNPHRGETIEEIEAEFKISAASFESLQREVSVVFDQMKVEDSLRKFQDEYEKIHRALISSHEHVKKLVKTCRTFNTEIINNQNRIKTALKLSQEDQKTITHLQKEMEKTWKLVYISQEKEARSKETINQLKEEMINLSKLVEKSSGMNLNQENLVKELKQTKEELLRQLEEKTNSITMLETQLISQHKNYNDLKNETEEKTRIINEIKEKLLQKESETARELKRKEKIQKELQEANLKLEDKIKSEEEIKAQVLKAQEQATVLEQKLNDARNINDKHHREYETLLQRTTKITEDNNALETTNKKLLVDINNFEKELKLKQIEIGRINTEKGLLERKIDKEHRAALHYQQLAEDAKTPLIVAQNEIESLKKEIESYHRLELNLLKNTDKIQHEKELQLKVIEKTEKKLKEERVNNSNIERSVKKLADENNTNKATIEKLKKTIIMIENEREKYSKEIIDQRANYVEIQEELKLKDIQISELKKRIVEYESKLKQQQQLYETVRADRNHYSKGLLESQDEIAELKKKFKIMGHQIEQLKEEIINKDQLILKEHYEKQKNEKLKENLQNELNRKNFFIQSNQELILKQENELKNLTSSLKKLDEESLNQRKEYDKIINERDILGTQLIRRNDELTLLYEKLRIQISSLKKGEAHYNLRLEDIKILKLKLIQLVREATLNKGNNPQVEELKREILRLQRELLQEKTKVTALSEELENPMNVHRWRKLEGSDPATFELIQKIQTLQKRLIHKTEEVVEKNLILEEKEKQYNELKSILARQPGPEVSEQLTQYQSNLKKKSSQLKAMASELNMYQAQINEYKYEQEKLTRELNEMKRKYYIQKRKEKMIEELEIDDDDQRNSASPGFYSRTTPASLINQQVIAAKSARTRYAGGGYAIK